MRSSKKVHGGRAMLNQPGFQTTAAMVAEIQDTGARSASPYDGTPYPDATLQFANCDRSIAFDFNFGTPQERANNLYKVDTMIDLLTQFRKGLALEQTRYARRRGSGSDDE